MTWKCAAIDHAVTFFPNGKIGPCCQIQSDYLKPSIVINDTNRFSDLKTELPPDACKICVQNELIGAPSYRDDYNKKVNPNIQGIQFLDIRNTNKCNLKCRYCGPHFSDKWAKELNLIPTVTECDIPYDTVITKTLQEIYFTGGEPMLNHQHWLLLETLIEKGLSKNITLKYNTNLMLIEYKKYNVFDIWKNFKKVKILGSVDAIGKPLECIRSGSEWKTIESNIQKIKQNSFCNIELNLTPVLSVLNIWWLDELYAYFNEQNIQVNPIMLYGPDYLAIDTIPDSLKQQALDVLNRIPNPDHTIQHAKKFIQTSNNQDLFQHTINHILYLDRLRDEKLFDMLPFDQIAKELILRNHEYE